MTLKDVKQKIAEIEKVTRDSEVAHSLEDDVYVAVLEHVAEHCTDAKCKALAREALTVSKMGFTRHYA